MAIPKSKDQKKVNERLRRLNRESTQFTEQEFREDSRAVKLLAMEDKSYVSELDDIIDQAFEHDDLLCEVAEVPKDLDLKEVQKATKKALGLSDITLIRQIAHRNYREKVGTSSNCPECDSDFDISSLETNIYTWVSYCHLVDQYIVHIKHKFPKFAKHKAPEKAYIKSLEDLAAISFMKDNMPLNTFIYFYHNYGLHQAKTAKADFLLSLELPNIIDDETAKKVVVDSLFTNKGYKKEILS